MQEKTEPEGSAKSFIVYLAVDIAADYIAVELGRTVAAVEYMIAVVVAAVVVECIVAELGHTAAAVECTVAEFGHTVAAVECSLSVVDKIVRRLVEPPADSFGALLAVKSVAHVQALLAPVALLEKCSSREQSAGRRLDWRSGRRLPEVALNSAASAPLSRLPAVELDLKPFVTFPAP